MIGAATTIALRSVASVGASWKHARCSKSEDEAATQRKLRRMYVHGYDARESERLRDQAGILVDLLHADLAYGPGQRVLEAGCGVGAQTISLAARSPHASFTSIDVSTASLEVARAAARAATIDNVEFRAADIFDLPFASESFDHVFVCFVLEHLARPVEALAMLHRVLRPGGTITVIEGDHGSTFFHPDGGAAREAIACQETLQRSAGGDASIGRRLYPLLTAAGYDAISVRPRVVYADGSRPHVVDGFTRKTFIAMIEGIRTPALAARLIEPDRFDAGLRELRRTTGADGVFCYSFFRGTGVRAVSIT